MEKKLVGFRATEAERQKLQRLCKATRRSMSDVLRVLLDAAESTSDYGLALKAKGR